MLDLLNVLPSFYYPYMNHANHVLISLQKKLQSPASNQYQPPKFHMPLSANPEYLLSLELESCGEVTFRVQILPEVITNNSFPQRYRYYHPPWFFEFLMPRRRRQDEGERARSKVDEV